MSAPKAALIVPLFYSLLVVGEETDMSPMCAPKAALIVPLFYSLLFVGEETDISPMCASKISLVSLLCSLLAVGGGTRHTLNVCFKDFTCFLALQFSSCGWGKTYDQCVLQRFH